MSAMQGTTNFMTTERTTDMANETATATSTGGSRRYGRTSTGEGDAYWFYGDLAILRSPEGAMPIVIEHHVHAGGSAPRHVHRTLDDSFMILSGRLVVECGDETFVANAGDYVSLPVGIPHRLAAVGDREAVLLQTHADPAFLNFIRAVGRHATEPRPDPRTMDFEAMNAMAGETGQPVVGAPMSAEEAADILRRAG